MLKVNPKINTSPAFKGALNNKTMLKGLEFISEHSTSFQAGVAFASAMVLRPFAISKIPNAKKENKNYLSANSIASGIIKLGIVEAIALPIEGAIKKIDKNPKEFLKKETIEALSEGTNELIVSKDYKFITQAIKSGANFLSAIPKSVFTVALLPVVMDKIFNKKEKEKTTESKKDNVSFKGRVQNTIAKGIGGILNNEKIQNFAQKNSNNAGNIARNTAIATDIALSCLYSNRIKKSKKIEESKKEVLITNEHISTAACIAMGTGVDEIIKKGTKGLVEKFEEANKNDPKILKYIEGINILRPTLVFALIYYGILPIFSGYLANKTDKEQAKCGIITSKG